MSVFHLNPHWAQNACNYSVCFLCSWYSLLNIELMSLYFTIKQFIKFIFNQFYIVTDHYKERSIRSARSHSSLPACLWPICSRSDCLGNSIHFVRSWTDRQKQKQSLHISPAQKWSLDIINQRCERLWTFKDNPSNFLFPPNKPCSLKCSGTQLHSTQANSLILNKWAIDFCLFSEQPGAFWTTIASSI